MRAIAASARENEQNATPNPTRIPPVRYNASPLSDIAIPATPTAYTTAPSATTLAVPNLSAIAPATGTPIPHNRFWIAIASEKVSRDQPLATVIGSRYRPKLARIPNPISEIKHADAITVVNVMRPGVALIEVSLTETLA